MVLLSFPAGFRFFAVAGPEKAKNLAERSSPPDSDPFNELSLKGNDLGLSTQFRDKNQIASTRFGSRRCRPAPRVKISVAAGVSPAKAKGVTPTTDASRSCSGTRVACELQPARALNNRENDQGPSASA